VGGLVVAFQTLKIGAQFCSALVTEVAVFFKGFNDDTFEFGGKIGVEPDGRSRGTIEDGFKDDAGGVAAKGKGSGRHFVEDGAEREEVRARVEFFAADLLGGHIGYRAKGRNLGW